MNPSPEEMERRRRWFEWYVEQQASNSVRPAEGDAGPSKGLAMNRNYKQGDRVRVTAANRVPGYQPGDKGTVVWEVASAVRGKLYAVMMDKDDPKGTCPVFAAEEIEADT